MIHLDTITLTFPDGDSRITAVDHVSLTAHPGTVTGITGPSGSGKSTVARCIVRLIEPSGGDVTIDGKSVGNIGVFNIGAGGELTLTSAAAGALDSTFGLGSTLTQATVVGIAAPHPFALLPPCCNRPSN